MDIEFHKDFKKRYQLLKPHERAKCDARLVLFREDPFAPVLHNHALHGEYAEYRNINIAGDLRALYMQVDDNLAYFVFLGTHGYLYE